MEKIPPMTRVVYRGDLHTEATHLRSGDELHTDAPVDNRGRGQAFSPTDLVATALASCILTVMGITAMDNDIDMSGAEAAAVKVMGSGPRRIVRLEVEVFMPERAYTEREIRLLEKAAHHCPVANSLHPDLEEVIRFHWK